MTDENRYTVRVQQTEGDWAAEIVDPSGAVVSTRACASEAEAHAYASTVRQHAYWLSEEKFRQYYRLEEPAPEGR